MLALTRRHLIEPPLPAARLALLRPDGAERPRGGRGRASGSAMADRLERAGAGLERHFPQLAAGEGARLLRRSYALIIGLWQMSAAPGRAPVRRWSHPQRAGLRLALRGRARTRFARAVAAARSASPASHAPARPRKRAMQRMMPPMRNLAVAVLCALLAGCAQARARRPNRCARCSSRRSRSARWPATAGFAGEVKPRHETDLAFRIGGKIVARSVDVGARVKKGQVLARLDPADVALQAEAAKARGRRRRGRVHLTPRPSSSATRTCSRRSSSAAPRSTRSATRSTPTARNSSRRRRSSRSAQNQAAYATLVATEDGVITAVSAEAGQVVAAGQPVMKLAREDEREVAISVPENRIDELARAEGRSASCCGRIRRRSIRRGCARSRRRSTR